MRRRGVPRHADIAQRPHIAPPQAAGNAGALWRARAREDCHHPSEREEMGRRTWGRSPGCWVQMPLPSAFPLACEQWHR
jgi:hypothetical protein